MSLALLLALVPLATSASDAGELDERADARVTPQARAVGPPASSLESASEEALQRGLAYLARRVAETPDGSFPLGLKGETREWAPVGVGALGALAFMAAGNSPGRGPYGREVSGLVDYLLSHTDLDADSAEYGYIAKSGDRWSRTHGHGFGTLVLAEAYGMTGRNSERLERALLAAVDLIHRSQGAEGGWHYEPRVIPAHESSITITYVQALRAARNSGIKVDEGVIHRAEEYVRRCQKEDGTFRYQLDLPQSTVGLTAAGIATLNMAGTYDAAIIQNGIDAILQREADPERRPNFPVYERLYVAQAFWQLSDLSIFERGPEDRLIKAAAFTGAVGDVLGPIETPLGLHLLQRVEPAELDASLVDTVWVRGRVLLISFAVAILATLGFSLIPAFGSTRADVAGALRAGRGRGMRDRDLHDRRGPASRSGKAALPRWVGSPVNGSFV